MHVQPEIVRGLIVAASVAYFGGVGLSPWLPPVALALAAVVVGTILAMGWRRAGRPRSAAMAAAAGLPCHLAILASGGLSSPLLPLVVPWLLWVSMGATFARVAALAGVAAFLLLAGELWSGGLTPVEPLEVAIVLASGLFPAYLLEGVRTRAVAYEGALGRILEEAAGGGAGADRKIEATRRLDELGRTLDRIRESLGARRAVLWDIQPAMDRARPRLASGGAPPPAVPLTGDPLRWAWEEALPLRLETPPRWAAGSHRACVVPLDPSGERASILTLEYDAHTAFPTVQALEETAARLKTFLEMQQQEARAVATRERFGVIAEVLRRLPREIEAEAFARELANAAVRIAEGTGGAVALWEQEVGHVLAVVGEDGGPHVDAVFGPLESEMALAARNATTLIRERTLDSASLPVAAPGERWHAEPRGLVVVPLEDTANRVVGVLAVWNADSAYIDPDVVEVLETLAPYGALQLQQARLLGKMREHAERDALTGLHNRRVFEQRLASENALFGRYRRPIALLILDVDHFKRINDTLGHEAGDAVLRALGGLLRNSIREVDLAARLGGEEFVVLLPETTLAAAREIAERLRKSVEAQPVEWRGKPIEVRISVGVAACPESVGEPRHLVRVADEALYRSKAEGRNRVTVASPGTVDHGPDFA